MICTKQILVSWLCSLQGLKYQLSFIEKKHLFIPFQLYLKLSTKTRRLCTQDHENVIVSLFHSAIHKLHANYEQPFFFCTSYHIFIWNWIRIYNKKQNENRMCAYENNCNYKMPYLCFMIELWDDVLKVPDISAQRLKPSQQQTFYAIVIQIHEEMNTKFTVHEK